uniref:Thioredoxin domain-containing protein n=1 Tax=Timspurckia oligopyrenoides TaxID=708627 RepID=A0A7S0ZKT6_9RHOD|mmetsp:Transcript_9216/g.16603  ORF Transcript_9216/g.16603 Transcript_9216/m.16603 type:complete len:168 (+) Transcript_9216:86-589(+)
MNSAFVASIRFSQSSFSVPNSLVCKQTRRYSLKGSAVTFNKKCINKSTCNNSRSHSIRCLVFDVSSREDVDAVLSAAGDSLVLIEFSSINCGPCKVIAPYYDELSEKFTDAIFLRCTGDDTAESNALMTSMGVRALPTFQFWRNKERMLSTTEPSPKALADKLAQLA